jgi:hypothetical protein
MTTTTFPVPEYVQESLQRRALIKHRLRACGAGIGDGRTCERRPAVLFPSGPRCLIHTPARERGLPEPGQTAYGHGHRADWLGWLEAQRVEVTR